MTDDIVDRLEQGFEALVTALDGQDPELIIGAAAAIRPLVVEIEETGVWREGGAIRTRLLALSKLIEAARFRVNKLTDLNQQRAINLSRAFGSASFPTYGRQR